MGISRHAPYGRVPAQGALQVIVTSLRVTYSHHTATPPFSYSFLTGPCRREPMMPIEVAQGWTREPGPRVEST